MSTLQQNTSIGFEKERELLTHSRTLNKTLQQKIWNQLMIYSRGPVMVSAEGENVMLDQQPNVLLLSKLRRLHDRLQSNYV